MSDEDIIIADEEALRNAIAENDTNIDREVRRLSRRGFIVAGAATLAAYGAWKFLRLASREGDVPWPLRRGLETNEKLSEAYFRTARLSRTFPPSAITNARINGGVGLQPNYDPENWRLRVEGIAGQPPATLTLSDLKSFPRRDMTTELRCIEGWSIVVHWTGTRLADLMARFSPPRGTRYVAMESPGRGYYVGLDMLSAMHPQTLLAYELNGAPLTWQHGAPLRLAVPVKYGYKNIKRIATIRYTDVRPADFWGERGYDWYAGH
ncbi:MAG TPA: molybdopterin-dependent oxidoreductase [Thermoanaerobaculia bacterium]|nr:molybdopterin-dependent oxidoreductase [Thermoanaerobaculia bacterium]